MTRIGSGMISSLPPKGVHVTVMSGYRTEPPARTFASFVNGRHPLPRKDCLNANAMFICNRDVEERGAGHHRDDAARIFVTLRLFPLPGEKLRHRH
jgi:hypothetical protein